MEQIEEIFLSLTQEKNRLTGEHTPLPPLRARAMTTKYLLQPILPMRRFLLIPSILGLCTLFIGIPCLPAQIKPGGGHSFDRDAIPGGSSSVITPTPKPQITRATTYVTLTPERTWTSADGKTLLGKLIAFEDMVIEVAAGQTPAPAKPPENPTVLKDGNLRLLVNKKPFILPLEKLSAADQEEVRKIESAHAPKSKQNQ